MIIDCNGQTLAKDGPVYKIVIWPNSISESDRVRVATELSRVLNLNYEKVLERVSSKKLREFILKRQVSKEACDEIRSLQLGGGVGISPDTKRYYPFGTLLSQTIGFTSTDGTGQSGLELTYNKYLTGKDGERIAETDSRGNQIADSIGIGFNRSHTGSNATAQYPDSLCRLYDDLTTCPEKYLLWFHHVPWTFRMKSGNSLWEELCRHYDNGVRQVREFQKIWDKIEEYVDGERFKDIQSRLKTQVRDAVWWKDACLLYFQEYSQLPIPPSMERPIHELEDLKRVKLIISNYECPTKELLNKNR